jgi:hypothetical protein
MALQRDDMRKKIRENLGDWPTVDKLGAAITDTTGLTFTATDYTKYGDGSWIEFPSGEVSRVDGTPTSSTVTLLARGMRNTTAATQAVQTGGDEDLGIVRINPKWFSHQLNEQINSCLSERVLKVVLNKSAITIVSNVLGGADGYTYTLPAAIKIERMRGIWLYDSDNKRSTPLKHWTPLKASGASGEDQITLHRQYNAGIKIGIEYYTGFTEMSDDATDCDLPDTTDAQLIPVYYATYALLQQIETPRLRKDKGTFKRRGTPLGARVQIGRDWLGDFVAACRASNLHPNVPGSGPVGPVASYIGKR